MSTVSNISDMRQVVSRIDTIILELEILRCKLTSPSKTTTIHNITEELFGAAGHGTWDEYDLQLDWARFSQ